ncbi:HNH endonuclease signature motif containing protein [Marinoscillum furvescens]|nr:HNH endonuclease signature motif containing protein [Marinoscillum furvescens]
MGFRVLDQEKINYIYANYRRESSSDMARVLGVSASVVKRFMNEKGLKVSKAQSRKWAAEKLKGKTSLTAEQDQFIKANYDKIGSKTIARKIGKSDTAVRTRMRQLGIVVPDEVKARIRQESYFKKGHNPANAGKKGVRVSPKSEFKKGQQPANTLHDGAISLRTHINYRTGQQYKSWHIRISKGKWIQLNRYVWEKEHGPIPPKHIISFVDGNPLNCDISNLECISMAENARRNRNSEKAGQTNKLNWEEGGSDKRVASYIVGADTEMQSMVIKEAPELLELKRTQFQLNKQINDEKSRRKTI